MPEAERKAMAKKKAKERAEAGTGMSTSFM